MRTCDRHDDLIIVYEHRGYGKPECPFCQVIEKLDDVEKTNEELLEQIENLEADLDEAKSKAEE